MNQELAQKVMEVAHLRGEFLLRSGKTSPQYFDKYQFESRPELLDELSESLNPPGSLPLLIF